MTRHQANMTLLEILKGYLTDNPDIRFGQALVNLNALEDDFMATKTQVWGRVYKDPFYEEPQETLKRVKETYK